MAIVSQTPSISEVKQVLAETSNSVGGLCTSPKINKWSKLKPVRHPSKGDLTEQEIKDKGYGFYVAPDGTTYYYKPRGGEEEPYRIGDFRGYNHNAHPPVGVQIISVNGNSTPPYIWRKNVGNTIEFRLLQGEIDPSDLNPKTNRVKNTDAGGGYGGLSWIGTKSDAQFGIIQVEPDSVFGTGLLITHTQHLITDFLPKLEYMRYLGDTVGMYENTGIEITEPTYTNDFILQDPYEDIYFNSYPTLMYNQISERVGMRVSINNESGSSVNDIRVTARYTINEPELPPVGENIDIFVEGVPYTLPTGTSGAFLPLTFYKRGQVNVYNVYAYLEKKVINDWKIISSTQLYDKGIYIPELI